MAVISAPNSILTEPPAPAAPLLLLGAGGVGERVANRANEHLAQTALAQAGGVCLLADAGNANVSDAVRDAVMQLTRQRNVSRMEQGHDLRQPRFEWLRLHVVFIAALAENEAGRFQELLGALLRVKHPAVGMEIVCILDASHPDDANEVFPNALSLLNTLEAEGRDMIARCREDWSASLRLRFYVTHPHRADGSRLDHPNLHAKTTNSHLPTPNPSNGNLTNSALPASNLSASALPGANSPVSNLPNSNLFASNSLPADSLSDTDEFESALAAAISAHASAGALYDGLAPLPGADVDAPLFALLGWSGDVLPRSRMLQRCAALLAADVLERTAHLASRNDTAENLLTNTEPEIWKAWQEQYQARLLDRRKLLTELLANQSGVELSVTPPPQPERKSVLQRLTASNFGDTAEPPSSVSGFAVRMNLPDASWRKADARRWPDEIRALDTQGAARFEQTLVALNKSGKAETIAADIVTELARCADACVRDHLGGSAAARQLLLQAAQDAEAKVRAANEVTFGAPRPTPDLKLPARAELTQAWERFEQECAKLPGWPAVIARGLGFGALVTTAGLALTLPVIPHLAAFWTVLGGMGGVGLSSVAYGRTLGRLARLGGYVRECLRAKYGQGLFAWAQAAAGTTAHEGIYQAVGDIIHANELPTLARFDDERQAGIAEARQASPFSAGEGTLDYLADADDADALYHHIRASITDEQLDTDARALLQAKIFAGWRYPTFDTILPRVRDYERTARLGAWERANKTAGDIISELLTARVTEPERREELFRAWVTRRLDLLALRCMILALRPPMHPERDNMGEDERTTSAVPLFDDVGSVSTSVRLIVPASFRWHAMGDKPGLANDEANVNVAPAASAAAQIARWFGGGGNATHLTVSEQDEAACLVTVAGLTAERAVQALGQGIGEAPIAPLAAPVTSADTNGHGSNGHDKAAKPLTLERQP